MHRFTLILKSHADASQVKYSGDSPGISTMKYLDITIVSVRFAVSAYIVYPVCSLPLKFGVSFMNPCFFSVADTWQ